MSTENRPHGQWLRSERARLGLTQAQVATIGGVSKTTQVAYEAGAHPPDLHYVGKLARAGFDEVFLLTGQRLSLNYDWKLVASLVDAILEWSQERSVRIPREKLEDLLLTLYQQFERAQAIDPAVLNRTLRLVA